MSGAALFLQTTTTTVLAGAAKSEKSTAVAATIAIAAASAIIGGFCGYSLRWREYRRDQRLKVYSEFLAAAERHVRLLEERGAFEDAMSEGNPHHQCFDEQSAERLRELLLQHEELSKALRAIQLLSSSAVSLNAHAVANFLITSDGRAICEAIGFGRRTELKDQYARLVSTYIRSTYPDLLGLPTATGRRIRFWLACRR